MDRRDALLWNAPKPPAKKPQPGQLLWSVWRPDDTARTDCERRDDGEFGAQVQLLLTGEWFYGRTFPTRALAVAEADEHLERLRAAGWCYCPTLMSSACARAQ